MSGLKQPMRITGVHAAERAVGAARVSTRRSWIAGVGALMASSGVLAADSSQSRPAEAPRSPRSIWPYQTPGVQFLLEARVSIAPVIEFGATPLGERRIIPITGGSFRGPHLAGTVLDEGEDTQLVRRDGVTEIAARYTLRTHDGVLIYVTNRGLIVRADPPRQPDTAPAVARAPAYVRTIPAFEAPRESRYEWLNQALYVGTLNPLPPSERAVVVRFFKVT
jgi:hypothetical protein